ncbi:cellulase family glycosylhydrolase [Undibacterium jejuense]|uniref:Cellulase family glycosylhydrolase n=1 Tax=Undibacterium jejuense TaxID=1344949 RepID=A0A923HPD9_9BURK|nr:cellulase family glycosylhydrolase [Undibacterium jejuense]MBC3862313.1 cellulase family glycosylhydrolase [Undibacterium jejuense]
MNYFPRKFPRVLFFALLFMVSVAPCNAQASNIEWYPFTINEDQMASITDFSGLNHPLGPADRLFVKGAHFYRVGGDCQPQTKDDQRVRLFGISLTGAANFPKEEDAPKISRRLRSLGFNAVRLHHLDTVLNDSEDKPQGILTTGAFPSFNQSAVQRLKTFIDALRREGIYVNLNLHVGYSFRYVVDQLTPLVPGENMPFASSPLHLFEPRMIALQVEYAKQLIRRLDLNNDPALAMIEINNESSLVGAWQRKDVDGLQGEYQRLLQQQWQRWAVRQYGSLDKACRVWGSCGLTKQGALLVRQDEARVLAFGDGWLAHGQQLAKRALAKIDVKSPSILEPKFEVQEEGAGRRVLDFVRFLSEMDKQYFETIRQAVRSEVGDLVPLTGTQMYYGGIINADSQKNMDYLDQHFYVDHYDFPHQSWDRNDWRIRDHSAVREGWAPLLKQAFYRDIQKPFVISEFNQAYPNRQSAEIMPVVTAIASAQDWDGLFLFQYADGNTWRALPDSFSLSGMGGQIATTGVSAAMFRQFQIPVLREQSVVTMTPDARLMVGAMGEGATSDAYIEYIRRTFDLDVRDAFTKRVGAYLLQNSGTGNGALNSAVSSHQNKNSTDKELAGAFWSANDGHLVSDRDAPNLRASGAYSAMFAGFSQATSLAGSSELISPVFSKEGRQFGVMMLVTRDAKPLNKSRRLLLTVSGATTGSQPDVFPARPKNLIAYPGDRGWWTLEPDASSASKPSGPRDATGPVWLERINVSFFYPSNAKRMVIYPLDQDGQRLAPVAGSDILKTDRGFKVSLNKSSPWYEVLLVD